MTNAIYFSIHKALQFKGYRLVLPTKPERRQNIMEPYTFCTNEGDKPKTWKMARLASLINNLRESSSIEIVCNTRQTLDCVSPICNQIILIFPKKIPGSSLVAFKKKKVIFYWQLPWVFGSKSLLVANSIVHKEINGCKVICDKRVLHVNFNIWPKWFLTMACDPC